VIVRWKTGLDHSPLSMALERAEIVWGVIEVIILGIVVGTFIGYYEEYRDTCWPSVYRTCLVSEYVKSLIAKLPEIPGDFRYGSHIEYLDSSMVCRIHVISATKGDSFIDCYDEEIKS
jgi:hypothetical protein